MLKFDQSLARRSAAAPRAGAPSANSLRIAIAAMLASLLANAALGAAPTLSAQQIVDRNVVARGGLAAWRGVSALSVAGKMDLGKPSVPTVKDMSIAQQGSKTLRKSLADAGLRRDAAAAVDIGEESSTEAAPVILPFELEMKRPHMSRLEIEFQKQKSVQTFDGTQGWKFRPYTAAKSAVPMSPEEVKKAAAQDDLDGLLIDYAAKGRKVAFDKVEAIDGHDQYKLRVTLKNGEARSVWVDAQTFLETRVDNKAHVVEGRWRATSTFYHDYRAVNGLMIPFVIESRTEGESAAGKMLVESVQVNPKLADARFGKPG